MPNSFYSMKPLWELFLGFRHWLRSQIWFPNCSFQSWISVSVTFMNCGAQGTSGLSLVQRVAAEGHAVPKLPLQQFFLAFVWHWIMIPNNRTCTSCTVCPEGLVKWREGQGVPFVASVRTGSSGHKVRTIPFLFVLSVSFVQREMSTSSSGACVFLHAGYKQRSAVTRSIVDSRCLFGAAPSNVPGHRWVSICYRQVHFQNQIITAIFLCF